MWLMRLCRRRRRHALRRLRSEVSALPLLHTTRLPAGWLTIATTDEEISALEKSVTGSHVLIFIASPPETVDHHEHMYEMDEPYPTAMHQDLKRGLEQERRLARNGSSDNNFQAGLPLFEVYQFLSPGMHHILHNLDLKQSAC